MKDFLKSVWYSFSLQLLVVHIRSNLLLLSVWAILIMHLTGMMGSDFGIPYLFLSPEYMGEVGFWSFFIEGITFGILIISWNLTTYLLEAHHFPFLASMERPFTKFCINNYLVPFTFLIIFLVELIAFAKRYEFQTDIMLMQEIGGFFVGTITFLTLISIYFTFTNKDIANFLKKIKKPPPHLNVGPGHRRHVDLEEIKAGRASWKVLNYFNETLSVRPVRSVEHYDVRLLERVFRQNHTNALVFQLTVMFLLVLLGNLVERPIFRIPAGASILLLASIILALMGAMIYWFSRWWVPISILFVLSLNMVTRYDLLTHKNQAYGLNYSVPPAPYNLDALNALSDSAAVTRDKASTIAILERWKAKNMGPKGEKPYMMLMCNSGGGLKAALWSHQVWRMADSLSKQQFSKHLTVITGASGGMIGAAYYRELLLQQHRGKPVFPLAAEHLDRISADLLNAISFSIVSNDLFLPWMPFEKMGHTYVKDRGYAFERQLNENVKDAFDKPMQAYQKPESAAEIPMMYFTPSIVNDGRRMIISPQGVSYLMYPPVEGQQDINLVSDAVDFSALFRNQGSADLNFTTAIRMNATFPYIMPNVYLPTQPGIELVDAGFRDNFGLKTTTRFLHVFKDWILENTKGVVLVQVRGYDRQLEIKPSNNKGVLESLFNPINIAGQVMELQDYEHDNSLGYIFNLYTPQKFHLIRFTYQPRKENEKAPISFHLTTNEKQDIISSIYNPSNMEAMEELLQFFRD